MDSYFLDLKDLQCTIAEILKDKNKNISFKGVPVNLNYSQLVFILNALNDALK